LRIAPFGTLALAALAASSCTFCTPMVVPDGVVVTLAAANGWPSGHYRFEVANLRCEMALPLGAAEPRHAPCSQSADGASVLEQDSVLEADSAGTGLTQLRLMSFLPPTPATLEVRVLRDDLEVTRQTLTPSYTTSEPNGFGCGETRIGKATLTL